MYKKVNITKELKQIPQDKLVRFLSSQLKKNEPLLKEFIKKFEIRVQQKFIQDYVHEAKREAKRTKRSIGKGDFIYYVTLFNKQYFHPKISFVKTLIKQEEYLESIKIITALLHIVSHIIAQNGKFEELGGKTTADKYENKLEELQTLLQQCYLNIKEEEQYLFDRKTFFTLFNENYKELLPSPIFNFIFIREFAKLKWLREILKQEDKLYFEKYIIFNK